MLSHNGSFTVTLGPLSLLALDSAQVSSHASRAAVTIGESMKAVESKDSVNLRRIPAVTPLAPLPLIPASCRLRKNRTTIGALFSSTKPVIKPSSLRGSSFRNRHQLLQCLPYAAAVFSFTDCLRKLPIRPLVSADSAETRPPASTTESKGRERKSEVISLSRGDGGGRI